MKFQYTLYKNTKKPAFTQKHKNSVCTKLSAPLWYSREKKDMVTHNFKSEQWKTICFKHLSNTSQDYLPLLSQYHYFSNTSVMGTVTLTVFVIVLWQHGKSSAEYMIKNWCEIWSPSAEMTELDHGFHHQDL